MGRVGKGGKWGRAGAVERGDGEEGAGDGRVGEKFNFNDGDNFFFFFSVVCDSLAQEWS